MNYKLEQTPEGPRWIKQTWNEETEKIEEESLPIGAAITMDPKDFVDQSNVLVLKEQTRELMTHEDGTPYTFEEFIDELEEIAKQRDEEGWEPCSFYNKTGDLLEILWSDEGHYVEHVGGQIEICRSFTDEKIVGAKVWGLKRIFLEAYANCDKPAKYVEIKALDPEEK